MASLNIRSRFDLPGTPSRPITWWSPRAGERLLAVPTDRTVDLLRLAPGAIEGASRVSSHADHRTSVAELSDVLLHELRTFPTQAKSEALDDALAEKCGSP